jgi:hypothetical protein
MEKVIHFFDDYSDDLSSSPKDPLFIRMTGHPDEKLSG